MKFVTAYDIGVINELYLKLKSYAAVSRATGFSPATVKKYVIDGYTAVDNEAVVHFEGNLPYFDARSMAFEDWSPLCILTDEERDQIKELWKELVI